MASYIGLNINRDGIFFVDNDDNNLKEMLPISNNSTDSNLIITLVGFSNLYADIKQFIDNVDISTQSSFTIPKPKKFRIINPDTFFTSISQYGLSIYIINISLLCNSINITLNKSYIYTNSKSYIILVKIKNEYIYVTDKNYDLFISGLVDENNLIDTINYLKLNKIMPWNSKSSRLYIKLVISNRGNLDAELRKINMPKNFHISLLEIHIRDEQINTYLSQNIESFRDTVVNILKKNQNILTKLKNPQIKKLGHFITIVYDSEPDCKEYNTFREIITNKLFTNSYNITFIREKSLRSCYNDSDISQTFTHYSLGENDRYPNSKIAISSFYEDYSNQGQELKCAWSPHITLLDISKLVTDDVIQEKIQENIQAINYDNLEIQNLKSYAISVTYYDKINNMNPKYANSDWIQYN